jgi:PAS domain S-box-containing protein
MFNNMKIGWRLAVGFGVELILVLALLVAGITSMGTQDRALHRIVEVENVSTQLANDLIDGARQSTIEVRGFLLATDSAREKTARDALAAVRQQYDTDFAKFEASTTQDETDVLNEISKVKVLGDSAIQAQNEAMALVPAGKKAEAIDLVFTNAYPKVKEWITGLDTLITMENQKTALSFAGAEKAYLTTRTAMLILGAIAILLVLMMSFSITRSITRPLAVTTDLIASRDLTIDSSAYTKGKNELAFMLRSFIRDITERTKLEGEMHAASLYSRSLIEASLDPLVTISQEGKITDVNETTIKATGVTREKLIGTDFSDYFTEPAKAREGYQTVFRQGSVTDYPLILRHSSGKLTNVLYNASVYKDEAGKVQGVFAAARDITEQKKAEEELNRHKEHLEETVQQRTAELTKILKEVQETTTVLSSSASEILAATMQLSAGATETATAVSETTTTVEEVKQTTLVTSQKARYVSDNAEKAMQAAKIGREAVGDTVASVNHIQEQIESIAETIVKLSEQGHTIGEIAATVTDIAEQVNLLSVNAAIEAAKAGEQGKGFTVVAQEIKSLAEQSKQATAQVRTILNDIQRGISAAVMVTEQGSKAADAGVKQAAESGQSIKILADSVSEAAQAAAQIAASSQQQTAGMDQVVSAMESINKASAESASSSKQVESSARDLSNLSRKLQDLVASFKTKE